jgi:hypothetical protein
MKAIVENVGPIEAWVKDAVNQPWEPETITGIDLDLKHPFLTTHDGFLLASLTDPTEQYTPLPTEWTHDWARWRAVDESGVLVEYESKPGIRDIFWRCIRRYQVISSGHDPSNWENSLQERPPKTRPMTAREFAKFVGENMGRYLYRRKDWINGDWYLMPTVYHGVDPGSWLYAENVEGELTWRELPEVESCEK